MTSANYIAWDIDRSQFSDSLSDVAKLKFFARYAILAPSGHNTQPWHFITADDKLVLKANPSRYLPYSGVQANEPYVSLGACIETLVLAAEGFGYKVDVVYALRPSVEIHVHLAGKTDADPSLLAAIVERVSNRYPYDIEPLPSAQLNRITSNRFAAVSIDVLSSREDIAYVAEQTDLATHRIFGDKAFRLELSKWVRNNKTRQHDGMPGFVQEIPTPPSMLAKHIIKHVNVSKDQSKKDTSRILKSANLILVTIKQEDNATLIDAGREYARICILAQQMHISTSGLGTAIIDPTARLEIIKKFGIEGKPVAIIRIGTTSRSARHTPRWTLAHVTD